MLELLKSTLEGVTTGIVSGSPFGKNFALSGPSATIPGPLQTGITRRNRSSGAKERGNERTSHSCSCPCWVATPGVSAERLDVSRVGVPTREKGMAGGEIEVYGCSNNKNKDARTTRQRRKG